MRSANVNATTKGINMKTDLEKYIDENFGGNKSAFARFMQVNSQQITKWVRDEWIVHNHKIYAPRREIPEFVKAKIVFSSTKRFPLYLYNRREDKETECYLTLDIKSGNIDVHVGRDCSPDVYQSRILHFRTNAYLTNQEIQDCIKTNLPTFQTVLVGSKLVYNGSEWVGEFNKDATGSIEELENNLLHIDADVSSITDDFDSYLDDDPFGQKYNAKSIDDVVSHILKMAEKCSDNLSDYLVAHPKQAVIDYYNYYLPVLSDYKEVPDWIRSDDEFSDLIDDS